MMVAGGQTPEEHAEAGESGRSRIDRGVGDAVVSAALPPGAATDNIGDWEIWNGATIRLCWSPPMHLPDHLLRHGVRAVVQQKPDGTLADEPLVYLGEDGWSTADARLIAQALVAAADVGERMATP
jgi:hypothetical protein